MKTFFILWFMTGINTHTLTTTKFDTEAECLAAARAMAQYYNATFYGMDITDENYECLKVEVK
jgi:hypothetical protein